MAIGQKMLRGKMAKTVSGNLDIYYRSDQQAAFTERPVVVISSFWDGGPYGVGHVETIRQIELDRFVAHSGNHATDST